MNVRSRCAAIAVAMVLASATAAAAEPDPSVERFNAGRAAMKDQRLDDAVTHFRASVAVTPTVGAWLNLGDCLERLGRGASAGVAFREAEVLARQKDDARADEAQARLARLKTSTLRVAITPRSEIQRARLDDVEIDLGSIGADTPIDAGRHVLRVTSVSSGILTRTIDVPTSPQHLRIELVLERGREAPPPTFRSAPSAREGTLVPALAAGGAGLVAIGLGTFFGVRSMGMHGDLERACAAYPRCTPDERTDADRMDAAGRSDATAATVSFVVGGALVAAGVGLYFLFRPGASSPTTTAIRF